MDASKIKEGCTYRGRAGYPSERSTVYALFEHKGQRYAVVGHPLIVVWMADVTELERFAKWAQAVVPDSPSATREEQK